MLSVLALLVSPTVTGLAPLQGPPPRPTSGTTEEAQDDAPLPRRGAFGLSFKPLGKKDAEKHGLTAGEGLVANEVVAGLTGAALGIQEGDIVLRLNGTPVSAATIRDAIGAVPAGSELALDVVRQGEAMRLAGPMLERPRDPGTETYSVVYDHVTHAGQRMRTIITKPKAPGRHPGFLFIQGFSPVSYDYVLSTATGDVTTIDGPLLHAFADGGFVTLRVEKPGVGDSEGGPFAELDFQSEIGIYAEALKQLKSLPEVDPDDVFLFGHSMGAAFGPMIAVDDPVRGIAVYGAAARTWFEYLLDTLRYQGLVAGDTFENADEKVRQGARLMALVMLEKKSPAEVEETHPELAPLVGAFFPGGLFNGKTLEFWRQLNDINFASYWSRIECPVLAVKGASDFVVYEADHRLIADIVNREHPGNGTFAIAPNSDHLFHAFATEQESVRNFQRGEFSPEFTTMLRDWIAKVRAK